MWHLVEHKRDGQLLQLPATGSSTGCCRGAAGRDRTITDGGDGGVVDVKRRERKRVQCCWQEPFLRQNTVTLFNVMLLNLAVSNLEGGQGACW